MKDSEENNTELAEMGKAGSAKARRGTATFSHDSVYEDPERSSQASRESSEAEHLPSVAEIRQEKVNAAFEFFRHNTRNEQSVAKSRPKQQYPSPVSTPLATNSIKAMPTASGVVMMENPGFDHMARPFSKTKKGVSRENDLL